MAKEHGVAETVLAFSRKIYAAKPFTVRNCDLEISMSGTLDGYVDLCITESGGRHVTYTLDPDGMRQMAHAALAVAEDVTTNCLYENDALLIK